MKKLRIIISGSIFWGYNFLIDFPEIYNIENTYKKYILDKTYEELTQFVKCFNLIKIQEDIGKIKYHIHTHDTYDELLTASIHNEPIYICSCSEALT